LQKYYQKVLYIKGLIKKNIFRIFSLERNYIFLKQLIFRLAAIAIIAIYKLLKVKRGILVFKILFYNILDLGIEIFFLIGTIIKQIADFFAGKINSFRRKLLLLFINKPL